MNENVDRVKKALEKLEKAHKRLEREREMRKAVELGEMKKWLSLELKNLAERVEEKISEVL